MKTAIYIEDGKTQLVLTPETDFEKGLVRKVEEGQHKVAIFTGSFYECQGGWVRQGGTDESLIFVMDIREEEKC